MGSMGLLMAAVTAEGYRAAVTLTAISGKSVGRLGWIARG